MAKKAPQAQTELPEIKSAEAQPIVDPEKPSGVADRAIVLSPDGVKEQIVHTYDEDGNLLGWHKEPVK